VLDFIKSALGKKETGITVDNIDGLVEALSGLVFSQLMLISDEESWNYFIRGTEPIFEKFLQLHREEKMRGAREGTDYMSDEYYSKVTENLCEFNAHFNRHPHVLLMIKIAHKYKELFIDNKKALYSIRNNKSFIERLIALYPLYELSELAVLVK